MRTRTGIVSALLIAFLQSGCTVVVEEPCECDCNGDWQDGEVPVVDMLVLVDLSLGSAQLAPLYEGVLEGLELALVERAVDLRQVAAAPLHHRLGSDVPLIFGRGPEGPFRTMSEAMGYYATENALSPGDGGELENLAVLGAALGRATVHDPFGTTSMPSPYYLEAADGLIVVIFSASSRRCAYDDFACLIDGQSPADYFMRGGDAGAEWLSLSGGSVPPNKVFHLSFVTAEIDDFERFADECASQPNFPPGVVDAMAPGGTAFYGPFVRDLRSDSGRAKSVDLCAVLSTRAALHLLQVAGEVRNMFQ